MNESSATARHIVVGMSGSAASTAALAWAAREAGLRDCALWLVRVVDATTPRAPYAGAGPSVHDENAAAGRELHRSAVALEADGLEVLEILVYDGLAARALMMAAEHADLLVLGTPEHHSPRVPTLGPTAAACVRSAVCPVVIVTPALAGALPGRTEMAGNTGFPGRERWGAPGAGPADLARLAGAERS